MSVFYDLYQQCTLLGVKRYEKQIIQDEQRTSFYPFEFLI